MAVTVALDPSVASKAYGFMRDRLRVLKATYGGTATIQALREDVLSQYVKEKAEEYNKRLRATRLLRNMFRQACDRITGRIFQVPVKIVEPAGRGEELAEDFDMRGNDIDRVGRTIYHEALKCGLYCALVEYPVVEARNLAEERAQQARPYVLLLDPQDVIRAYQDDQGNWTHVAWETQTVKWDEASRQEVVERRIHERYPGRALSWIEVVGKGWQPDGAERTIRVPGPNPTKIMFHAFYAEREAPMVGRTPLTEVADLTLEHFGLGAEFKNALRKNLFPVLTATGVEEKKLGDIAFTPETILGSTNDKAKFEMLEHKGLALEAGSKHLDGLEQRAEAYAGRLTKPTGDVKATTEALSAAEVSSFAKDMALSLQAMLQEVLDDFAIWEEVDSLGEVQVNLDFAVDFGDSDMTTLQGMRGSGDVSRQTLWREARRRNVLGADFDEDEETRLLEDEQAEAMDREKAMLEFSTEQTITEKQVPPAAPKGGPTPKAK